MWAHISDKFRLKLRNWFVDSQRQSRPRHIWPQYRANSCGRIDRFGVKSSQYVPRLRSCDVAHA